MPTIVIDVAQVVGRLAGDQLGVVQDTLVAEGLMEVLLAVVERDRMISHRMSSEGGKAASLALLCLADLVAGSERAKVRIKIETAHHVCDFFVVCTVVLNMSLLTYV